MKNWLLLVLLVLPLSACAGLDGAAKATVGQPVEHPTTRPATKDETQAIVGEAVGKVVKDVNTSFPGYGTLLNSVLIVISGLYLSRRTDKQTQRLNEKTDDQTAILKKTVGE